MWLGECGPGWRAGLGDTVTSAQTFSLSPPSPCIPSESWVSLFQKERWEDESGGLAPPPAPKLS